MFLSPFLETVMNIFGLVPESVVELCFGRMDVPRVSQPDGIPGLTVALRDHNLKEMVTV